MAKVDPSKAKAFAEKHPAYWAMCYRRIHGLPWTFDGREYLKAIHEDRSKRICVVKGAQTGFTETAINLVFFRLLVDRRDVLYVLPGLSDASTVSASRIATAIEESPVFASRQSKYQGAFLKRINGRTLYIRGSNSRSQLKSIPVAGLFLDEFEEMEPANVALARERTSGQNPDDVQEFNFSTPYKPGWGISAEFDRSDQHYYHIPCVECGEYQSLGWPESFDLQAVRWKCRKCGCLWSDQEKVEMVGRGKWIPRHPDRVLRGYHLSQLYSPTLTAEKVKEKWKAAEIDTWTRQEWYNSVLAQPHLEEASRLPLELINSRKTNTYMLTMSEGTTAMGIDVGTPYCFWVVATWTPDDVMFILAAGKTETFKELGGLLSQYNVRTCVIDANPERRKVREFCDRHVGRVYMCYYPETKDFVRWRHEDHEVSANRTETLDRYLGRYKQARVVLPCDVPESFIKHHHNLVRVLRKTPQTGGVIARYEPVGDDHFVHAANYAEIAGLLCGSASIPDIPGDPEVDRELKQDFDHTDPFATVWVGVEEELWDE